MKLRATDGNDTQHVKHTGEGVGGRVGRRVGGGVSVGKGVIGCLLGDIVGRSNSMEVGFWVTSFPASTAANRRASVKTV